MYRLFYYEETIKPASSLKQDSQPSKEPNKESVKIIKETIKQGSLENPEAFKDKYVWIDFVSPTQEELAKVKEIFDLHPLTIEDLTNQGTRIKVEVFDHYLFGTFYGIKKNYEPSEIEVVLGKKFFISSHSEELPIVAELCQYQEKLLKLFKKGPEFIMHKLLDAEIDNYFPVLEGLSNEIEEIEEEVTKSPSPDLLPKIIKTKRILVSIKKITMPQREKLSFFAKRDYDFIAKKAIPYFRDLYDHAVRVSDAIETYREEITNTYEFYISGVSNEMNKVMKLLSIIATIALPLTVISSIYGTNFENLPGSKAYLGFWVMLAAMFSISLVMVYYFKSHKWI